MESLLLALGDRNVLPEYGILGLLSEAILAHSDVPVADNCPGHHAAVAAEINSIPAEANSVRRR